VLALECVGSGMRWLWNALALECVGSGMRWLWNVLALECREDKPYTTIGVGLVFTLTDFENLTSSVN
jgi:hypothetical protein